MKALCIFSRFIPHNIGKREVKIMENVIIGNIIVDKLTKQLLKRIKKMKLQ